MREREREREREEEEEKDRERAGREREGKRERNGGRHSIHLISFIRRSYSPRWCALVFTFNLNRYWIEKKKWLRLRFVVSKLLSKIKKYRVGAYPNKIGYVFSFLFLYWLIESLLADKSRHLLENSQRDAISNSA